MRGRYYKPGHPRREEAMKLLAQGVSRREITERLGLGEGTLREWIAEGRGYVRPSVRNRVRGPAPHEKKPNPNKPRAIQLYASGMRVVEIAPIVGVSANRVWAWIREAKNGTSEGDAAGRA